MIIASKNITNYLPTLAFPVEILEEAGPRTALIAGLPDLLTLIDLQAVIGVGSWKRIKHFRMNRPVESLESLRVKLKLIPTAEDNKTTWRESYTHTHHMPRSAAYGNKMRLLTGYAANAQRG